MTPRRADPTPWTPRSGDAPPASLLEREPLLADLENNALFRLYHYHRRRGLKRMAAFILMLVGIRWFAYTYLAANIDAAMLVRSFGGAGGGILAAALVVVVWVAIVFLTLRWARRRAASRDLAHFFGVPVAQLDDLIHASTPARDFAQAAWGLRVGLWANRSRRIVLPLQIAFNAAAIVVAARRDWPGEWILWLFLAANAVAIGLERDNAYMILDLAARHIGWVRAQTRRGRLAIDSESGAISIFHRVARTAGSILRVAGVAAVLLVVAFAVASNYGWIYHAAPFDLSRVPGRWTLGVVVAAVGFAAGSLRGRRLRGRGKETFDRLTADLEALLQAREDGARYREGSESKGA